MKILICSFEKFIISILDKIKMNTRQIETLDRYGLTVASIKTNYELKSYLDLNKIKARCDELQINFIKHTTDISVFIINVNVNFVTGYITYNNKLYKIDFYENGRLTIYNAFDSLLILEFISQIIILLNINFKEKLDVNNLKITLIQCVKSIQYNVDIEQIVPSKFYKSKNIRNKYSGIIGVYYIFGRRKTGNTFIHPNKEIEINALSYSDTIYIYEHIYSCTLLPIVLNFLNKNLDSLLSIVPKEIIDYIIDYTRDL